MGKVTKHNKVDTEILTDTICDWCGKSCKQDMDYECSIFQAHWGYGSKKDCESWECYLCEDCSDKLKDYIEKKGGKVIVSSYG